MERPWTVTVGIDGMLPRAIEPMQWCIDAIAGLVMVSKPLTVDVSILRNVCH
jgi:hypothetical protein